MTTATRDLQRLDVLNLREHVEQRVREAILSGVYEHGERLIESDVATKLGVSRAPVREALSGLEREGIVKHIPRRGYFVVEFTQKDIDEIYSLRLLLEVEALKRTIERLSDRSVTRLQTLVDRLGEAVQQPIDPRKIVEADLAFHDLICRSADHGRLYSAWRSLYAQTRILVGLTSRTHYQQPEQPRERHQRIVDSIRDRDMVSAEAALREHHEDARGRAAAALGSGLSIIGEAKR